MLFDWLCKAEEVNCNLFPRGNRTRELLGEEATAAASIADALRRNILSIIRSPALALPLSGSSTISRWIETRHGPFKVGDAVAVEEGDLRGLLPLLSAAALDVASLVPEKVVSNGTVRATATAAAVAAADFTTAVPPPVSAAKTVEVNEQVESLATRLETSVSITLGSRDAGEGIGSQDKEDMEKETKEEAICKSLTALDWRGFTSVVGQARHHRRFAAMLKKSK